MSGGIVFMGTPQFAVPSLQALVDHGYEVTGVFCQPDRPSGRGRQLAFCPVKQLTLSLGLPVFQPEKMRLDGAQMLKALSPKLCVTAAFGQILSQENLDTPELGTVNVHASLLPKYRGSAPINWALINGETVTGVTTMLTDRGLDTGDILLRQEYVIPEGITAGELTDKLSVVGAELLVKTLPLLMQGNCPREKQNEAEMSYFPMLTKDTGRLDFRRDAVSLVHLIHGVSPWPGAFFTAGGETVKVWDARAVRDADDAAPGRIMAADAQNGLRIQAGNGTQLQVLEMQMPGGKRMRAQDYLRGHSFPAQFADMATEE